MIGVRLSIKARFFIVCGLAAAIWLVLNVLLLNAIDAKDMHTARLIWAGQMWLTPLGLVGAFIMVKDHATGRQSDELWQALGTAVWMAAVYATAFYWLNQSGQEPLLRLWFLR